MCSLCQVNSCYLYQKNSAIFRALDMKARKFTTTKHGRKFSEPSCCLSRNPKQSSLTRTVATRSSSSNQVECVDLTSEIDSDYDSVGLDQTVQNEIALKMAKSKPRCLKSTDVFTESRNTDYDVITSCDKSAASDRFKKRSEQSEDAGIKKQQSILGSGRIEGAVCINQKVITSDSALSDSFSGVESSVKNVEVCDKIRGKLPVFDVGLNFSMERKELRKTSAPNLSRLMGSHYEKRKSYQSEVINSKYAFRNKLRSSNASETTKRASKSNEVCNSELEIAEDNNSHETDAPKGESVKSKVSSINATVTSQSSVQKSNQPNDDNCFEKLSTSRCPSNEAEIGAGLKLVKHSKNNLTTENENAENSASTVKKKEPKYFAKPSEKLSLLEQMRLKNLADNQKFLEEINLTSQTSVLAPKPPKRVLVRKELHLNLPKRESKRLRRESPPLVATEIIDRPPPHLKIRISEVAGGNLRRTGSRTNFDQFKENLGCFLTDEFVNFETRKSIAAVDVVRNLSKLKFQTIKMGLDENESIFDINFHPSNSKLLLAMGCSGGTLQFLDISQADKVWGD